MRAALALLALSLCATAPANEDFVLTGPVPARIGLAAVEAGGRALPLGTAGWSRSGRVAERDFGCVVERYVIEDHRVEQLFVVRDRCEGPIVVRSRIDAPLPQVREVEPWSEVELLGGGLVLTDGRTRLLYYGAKAIDASGRELALQPRWSGGHAVLTVPAAFVTAAEFPLTIDPWVQFGGSGTSVGVSNSLSGVTDVALAVDAAGNPNVAWVSVDATGFSQAYFRRWNGTSWEELAGSGSGSGLSNFASSAVFSVSLALDGAGNPQVAYSGTTGAAQEVWFRRWNGTTWQELAGSGTGEGISTGAFDAYAPSLVLDSSDNPAIAFQRDTVSGNPQIHLLNWDGASWVGLAGSGTGNGISGSPTVLCNAPSLAGNASGKLAVAWSGLVTGVFQVFYREFNAAGPSWDELGGSGTGGGLTATPMHSQAPSLALESGGNPVVAWQEQGVEYAIHLRRWTGASWAQIGGSATGTGISGPGQFAFEPSLALDASNNPRVAWEAHFGTQQYVYYREWSGTAWVERDGSATGEGIDGGLGTANAPRLRIAPAGVAVIAWHDVQAYVRAFQALSFTALTQHSLDGTSLTVGATTTETAVKFRGTFAGDTFSWRMQIEAQPIGTAFTDVPQAESPLLAPGQTAEISLPLANGSYHWQARAVTDSGGATAWVSFGSNGEGATDVIVAFVGSGGTTVINKKSSKCGLVGAEALLLLLVVAVRKRR